MKRQEGKQSQQTNASFEYFLCLFCIFETKFHESEVGFHFTEVILNSEPFCLSLLGLEACRAMPGSSFSFLSQYWKLNLVSSHVRHSFYHQTISLVSLNNFTFLSYLHKYLKLL